MDKETAEQIKQGSINAITELSKILFEVQHTCPPDEFEVIRRGVGLTIGRIQLEILNFVYDQFPEMDHLK